MDKGTGDRSDGNEGFSFHSKVSATAPASEYYSRENNSPTATRARTLSMKTARNSDAREQFHSNTEAGNKYRRRRRGSHDEKTNKPIKFLVDVEETARLILAQEDTDGDFQITINDAGPKVLKVGTFNSGGYKKHDIRGTYMLSNLLQELALARDYGRRHIIIDEARLSENPVDRLSRMIKHTFWKGLTRSLDADVLEVICNDPKNRSCNKNPLIYVPYNDEDAFTFYSQVAQERPHLDLVVERLPKDITPQYVKSINQRPGILSLGLRSFTDTKTNEKTFRAIPFVVPGGRFNEMYGWDSYFESLGLLIDGYVELARDMVDNFVYQITHYGKILNANRSYYLTRSQPPFLTDMALRIYAKLEPTFENRSWLAVALRAAIKEYHTVWMSPPRFDPKSGLSRYHPTGIGMPPETEATHFTHVMEPYAAAMQLDVETYMAMYDDGRISEPRLDRYFVHDRAVRESGHDTTYRLEKKCADLATIDLNCLLYKYEIDIANTIRDVFHGHLPLENDGLGFDGMEQVETPDGWFERASYRKYLIDKYCWDEAAGLYFDYDTVREHRSVYESVTALWPLWAGCASPEQAERVVPTCLRLFEVTGGLVCGTECSRGKISLERPNRQWDYPFGWAPHQIMAWQGLSDYGFTDVARRLAYRWLYTITKSFVDFNGVVPEKFDIVSMTHQVKVEYGNVGTDFKFVPREGFGWMNASFQTGLQYLSSHMRRTLGTLTSPDSLFSKLASRDTNLATSADLPVKDEIGNSHLSAEQPLDVIAEGIESLALDEIPPEFEEDSSLASSNETSPTLPNPHLPSSSQLVKMFAEISHPSHFTDDLADSPGADPAAPTTDSNIHDEEATRSSTVPLVETKFISVEGGEVICTPEPAAPLTGSFYRNRSASISLGNSL